MIIVTDEKITTLLLTHVWPKNQNPRAQFTAPLRVEFTPRGDPMIRDAREMQYLVRRTVFTEPGHPAIAPEPIAPELAAWFDAQWAEWQRIGGTS